MVVMYIFVIKKQPNEQAFALQHHQIQLFTFLKFRNVFLLQKIHHCHAIDNFSKHTFNYHGKKYHQLYKDFKCPLVAMICTRELKCKEYFEPSVI